MILNSYIIHNWNKKKTERYLNQKLLMINEKIAEIPCKSMEPSRVVGKNMKIKIGEAG